LCCHVVNFLSEKKDVVAVVASDATIRRAIEKKCILIVAAVDEGKC